MLDFPKLCVERPIGTYENNNIIEILCNAFGELNYRIIDLPFQCTLWHSEYSFVECNGNRIKIFPSPFSQGLKGNYPIKYVSTLEELKKIKGYNGILIFINELSENAKMPNNFPFYFPDEDKELYESLERINPKGIIAITGQDQSSGLNPFPLFEDVNLKIPTAFVSSLENIAKEGEISLEINSKTSKEKSKQIIFRKEGLSKDIILIIAHMDTKYFTNGALDNAAGVYTLHEIAKIIENKNFNHTIEIVPFNGEDHPEVSGQLAYLEYLDKNGYEVKNVINIDGTGHIGSKNMFSFFNYDENCKVKIIGKNNLLEGEQWYSGDHGVFAFQNIPCIAVTSSDMFTDSIKITHTKNDIMDIVDIELLKSLGKTIENIIEIIDIQ